MIHLDVLGGLSLRGPDGTELRAVLAQPKRLALLVFLALARPGAYARRDTLLALFWPQFSPERARQALRQSLYHLRRHLGNDALRTRGANEVGMNPAYITCDAVTFGADLAAGRLTEAARAYGGELLPGFLVADTSPELERWLERERADLRAAAQRLHHLVERRPALTTEVAIAPRRRWRARLAGLAVALRRKLFRFRARQP